MMLSQFVISPKEQCYGLVNTFECVENVLAARWTV